MFGTGPAAGVGPIEPRATTAVPVCGMFTARVPRTSSRRGHLLRRVDLTFDGPKDLFTFLLSAREVRARTQPIGRRAGSTSPSTTRSSPIDAETAFFVAGSDVRGPMGAELIPFATREDAEAFRATTGAPPCSGFERHRSRHAAGSRLERDDALQPVPRIPRRPHGPVRRDVRARRRQPPAGRSRGSSAPRISCAGSTSPTSACSPRPATPAIPRWPTSTACSRTRRCPSSTTRPAR